MIAHTVRAWLLNIALVLFGGDLLAHVSPDFHGWWETQAQVIAAIAAPLAAFIATGAEAVVVYLHWAGATFKRRPALVTADTK